MLETGLLCFLRLLLGALSEPSGKSGAESGVRLPEPEFQPFVTLPQLFNPSVPWTLSVCQYASHEDTGLCELNDLIFVT